MQKLLLIYWVYSIAIFELFAFLYESVVEDVIQDEAGSIAKKVCSSA